MKTFALTIASLTAALTAVVPRTAHALGPVDIEIAGRVGYATNPSSNDFATNPYGFGLGGRAGVSIFGIYAGFSGIYYLGTSTTIQGVNASLSTAMEGFDVGYTLPIPYVKLRPQVGIGNQTITTSAKGQSLSTSNLYLEPGVVLLVPIGSVLFVGADVNALILPSVSEGSQSKTYVAPSFHAQVGVKF